MKPDTPNSQKGKAPQAPHIGSLHDYEPDDCDDLLAGNLWELDEQDGDTTSVDHFLATLHDAGIPTADLQEKWRNRGRPTSSGPCLDLIHEAVSRSLRAGYDAYDSDTRTWIFKNRVECDACNDGAPTCKEAAATFLKGRGNASIAFDLATVKAHVVDALDEECQARGTENQGKDDCANCLDANAFREGRLLVCGPEIMALVNACVLDPETRKSSHWDGSSAKDHADDLDFQARTILGLPHDSSEE